MGIRNEAVVTEELVKVYEGGVRALDGVSLRVGRGEVFALLGPNGAGKTTLVEILLTLRRPTSGRAYVLGEDVSDPRSRSTVRSRVGAVLQESDSFELLTVRETLELYASLYGADRRRVDELLELFGLSGYAKRLYGKLSGGLKRRVLVATALINSPELVFLDEPTTGLDPAMRREVWEVLRRMREEGVTVFLTTHYMEEAEELADRVGFIVGGRLVAVGSPRELAERYGGSKVVRVSGLDRRAAEEVARALGDVRSEGDGLVYTASDQRDANRAVQTVLSIAPDAVITVSNPGLEEVFLKLTGYRITEEGEVA
ncbi:MAG: ABC transporter ATP-binding protein [Nitrososphaerota archaeon]|nr:ABC transporter ATP-binding protein [Candidatus Calditenuis fumarioli]